MTSYYDKDGSRNTPYKEDSTKGSSVIQPLNYKGDVLSQVWMDSRLLATLANWMDKNGVYPRFMSEIIREPLRMLVEQLVSNGEIEMVDDTVAARDSLSRRFRIDLNRGGRGGKNVLHNQILTDKRIELGEKLRSGSRYNDAQTGAPNRDNGPHWIPLPGFPDLMYPEGDTVVMNKLIAQAKAKQDAEIEKQKAGMRERGSVIADVREGMTMEEVNERQERIDKAIIEKENAPLDMEFLRSRVVKS